MMAELNPTELLKEYFLKSLLIQSSTKTIDDNWGKDLARDISHHVFPDPFTVDVQTGPDQVQHFNKLMRREDESIPWLVYKNSKCNLDINEENKNEIIPDTLSQLYLLLSIPLFENLIILLKSILTTTSSGTKSISIINTFYKEYKAEIHELDRKNVSFKYPIILLLHNLRLFRNCITHSDGSIVDLNGKFDEYNKKLKECKDRKNGYEVLENLGPLSRQAFGYRTSQIKKKIYLDNDSFKKLLELYSQLAYIAYLCYCNKYHHPIEI